MSPTYALWSKIGCPPEYSGDETYGEGDEVSLNGLVHRCKPFPFSGYCNLYSPDSVNGYLGWETLGSCTGTIAPSLSPVAAPTSSPSVSPTYPLWSKVGCPEAFDTESSYSEGDTVELDGKVYEVSQIRDRLI